MAVVLPTYDCEVDDGVPGGGLVEVDPAPVEAGVLRAYIAHAQQGGEGLGPELGTVAQAGLVYPHVCGSDAAVVANLQTGNKQTKY